jgi:nitrile hydratase accessory protein
VSREGQAGPADEAAAVSRIPSGSTGVVFCEPWEAQAFAIAVALNERGLFSWTEWAAALADEIRAAQARGDPDTGETYYRHWLAALERLTIAKHATDAATLARYRDAWEHAAARTSHGTPIELAPEDFDWAIEKWSAPGFEDT